MRIILATTVALVVATATAHAGRHAASSDRYGERFTADSDAGRCAADRCYNKHPTGIYTRPTTKRWWL